MFNATQRFSTLKELTLNKNSLDGFKLRNIREMLSNNKGLIALNLNQCQLGEWGAVYLALGLENNRTLKTLNVADNNFGDEGMEYLTQSMINHRGLHLTHWDLSQNYISDVQGVKIAEGLASNNTLEYLSLQSNTLTMETGQAFKTLMHTHRKLAKIDLSKNLVPLSCVNEINKVCD